VGAGNVNRLESVKRSGFAAAATLAATLAVGVSGAFAASLPKSPLAQIAAHDGVSVPSSLAHAIQQKLGAAPAAAAAAASQARGQQQELSASDGMPVDLFGLTVALSGDGHTALVGAPGRTVGAAYIFVEQGGKWTQQQEIDSPAGSAQDSYGLSVALSGDGSTALVGAPTGGTDQAGIVYSYARQGGTYVLNGQLTPTDGAFSDEFGASVSLSALGNVALIGAPIHNGYQGAAYVFVHGAHAWSEQREFQNPDVAGSAYGISVSEAPDGLTGVVGAPLGNDVQGAAFVVSELNGSQQELVASDASEGAFFGVTVSMNALGTARSSAARPPTWATARPTSSTTPRERGPNPKNSSSRTRAAATSSAIRLRSTTSVTSQIGSPGRNGTDGSAYTFAGYPTLTQQRELDDPLVNSGGEYGFSVALNALGNQLLIGAPYSNDAQGAAWAASN